MVMKTCDKCGAANEADVRFCVNCGNRLTPGVSEHHGHESTVRVSNHQPHQAKPMRQHTHGNAQHQGLQYEPHAANPLQVIWTGFLFSERMILVGAAVGFIASIMVLMGNGTNYLSAFAYFAAMAASLVVLYLSINTSAAKKIELARWQIAIGAYFMLSLSSVYYLIGTAMGTTVGSFDMSDFSELLTLVSSVLVLVGAIKLQGELLRK